MTDNATEKFDLVNDEDSCCGLMHIVDDHENNVCSGYDERNMVGIVDKLNQHYDLVEALTLLLHEVAESGNYCANDFGWPEAIIKSEKALAKADGEKG
jgi:hypothetical protein